MAGEKKKIDFGSQIRSYTLHPSQRVKDHRTDVEIGNAQAVLDGDLDEFIRAFLLQGERVVATEAEILAARRARAERLRAAGRRAVPRARAARPHRRSREILARFGTADADALERRRPRPFCVAGRIVALRSFGKMAFATLQSDGERLQVWLQQGRARPDAVERSSSSTRSGDFVWARGPLVRTQKGELTVDVRELGFLAKSLPPAAREVPRAAGRRGALPPALPGPARQPRGAPAPS